MSKCYQLIVLKLMSHSSRLNPHLSTEILKFYNLVSPSDLFFKSQRDGINIEKFTVFNLKPQKCDTSYFSKFICAIRHKNHCFPLII